MWMLAIMIKSSCSTLSSLSSESLLVPASRFVNKEFLSLVTSADCPDRVGLLRQPYLGIINLHLTNCDPITSL
jgi:hypothetical protein